MKSWKPGGIFCFAFAYGKKPCYNRNRNALMTEGSKEFASVKYIYAGGRGVYLERRKFFRYCRKRSKK